MKRFYKMFASWFLCLFLVLSQFIVSFADVNSLMIASSSDALMTLELDDLDYSVMPFSSIVSIDNTVNYDYVDLYIRLIDVESGSYLYENPNIIDDWGEFLYRVPSGYELDAYGWRLKRGALPSPGKYQFQLDYSSDSSVDYSFMSLVTTLEKNNVAIDDASANIKPFSQQNSGDFYSNFVLEIGAIDTFRVSLRLSESLASGSVFAGRVKFAFSNTDDSVDISGAAFEGSVNDYDSDVSSSLSDLSSSVDTMTDEISEVTEAIQNLHGAMEPHYSNVLTQLHHITEQLHAFYDQIYNNIHLKEYALWQDIKTAIENIDLEVNVNLDKLKSSIDNMSQAIQNKLQSVQDTLTNGFDNSSINQDAAELDQSLQEYEEAEQTVIDQVNDSLNDFEFDSGFEEYTNTIKVFSDFIQDLYEASGGFKVVINLSLMLSIAGIVIGVYRFRDGG